MLNVYMYFTTSSFYLVYNWTLNRFIFFNGDTRLLYTLEPIIYRCHVYM